MTLNERFTLPQLGTDQARYFRCDWCQNEATSNLRNLQTVFYHGRQGLYPGRAR